MAFSGEPKRRGSLFRILELPSITIKKKKHFFNKKIRDLLIVEVTWALVFIKSSFFFDTFFALFSANSGESDVFGGIRISSLILLFWRQLSRNAGRIVGYQKSHFCFLACSFVKCLVDL